MRLRRLLAPSFLLLAAGCGAGAHAGTDPRALIAGLSKTDFEHLSKKRIYFGHQSVGFNIVDGLLALEKANPEIGLTIKETRDPAQITSGVFAHGRVGQNQAPSSKIRDFTTTLEGGLGENVDVAFFKFCYVDLVAVGERPGASNRQVGDNAGIADPGQILRLLGRLDGLGLVQNTGAGHAKGASNSWRLTVQGVAVHDALRVRVSARTLP